MKAANRRLLSPLLLWFMGTMILANIAGRMIGPLESLYVQELGASVGQVGLFFTLASILPLVFQLLGGWLSDKKGERVSIVGGFSAISVGWAIFLVGIGVALVEPYSASLRRAWTWSR